MDRYYVVRAVYNKWLQVISQRFSEIQEDSLPLRTTTPSL
jgi:hypothetical protein